MNERVARMLHVALIGGVAATFLVLAVVRDLTDMDPAGLPVLLVRAGAFVLAMGTLVAHRVLRAALPSAPHAPTPPDWWRANAGRVVVLWGIAEGLAMAGAVFWFLTGDFVTFLIAGGVGLFLLAVAHPGRLVGA